jgi:hypothetical protein
MPQEETNPERLAPEEYAELDDTPRIERFKTPKKARKKTKDIPDWKVRRHLRQRREG